MHVNVAHILTRSASNGPGERFVIWAQGCPLACPGCWNKDTWPFVDRDLRGVAEIVDEITRTDGIEGVTFTGGEPFAQAEALAEIARSVRGARLSVFVFTGYELDELTRPEHQALLKLADVVVTGRYIAALRECGLPWRGSTNQQVFFLTDRYNPADMEKAPPLELRIDAAGTITVSGFPTEWTLGKELTR